jgi:hypothetical protein
MVNNITIGSLSKEIYIIIGSVHRFLKTESENRTKSHRFLICSVSFLDPNHKNNFFFQFVVIWIVGSIEFLRPACISRCKSKIGSWRKSNK